MAYKIRVPATSANLGPGFDVLGLAVSLYATFTVEASEKLVFHGVAEAYANEDNLFWKSYTLACKALDRPLQPLSVSIQSEIPIARGLGSSAAMIVGGITAAYAIHKLPLNRGQILDLATRIEGHPDNVAPAVYGGLRASLTDKASKVSTLELPIHPSLKFLFLIPDFELLTETTRAVLPKTYPLRDFAHNGVRLIYTVKALEKGDIQNLVIGLDDVLHQPYRFPLIEDTPELFHRLKLLNLSAYYLSGAGPTIGVLTNQMIQPAILEKALHSLKAHWRVIRPTLDHQGVTLEVPRG